MGGGGGAYYWNFTVNWYAGSSFITLNVFKTVLCNQALNNSWFC